MNGPILLTMILLVGLFAWGAVLAAADTAGGAGQTSVMKWKDGKKAVFFLGFDDGCPTHLKHVIPALKERRIPGTFYVIAGNGNFKDQPRWIEEAKSPYILLGNHTFTHKGAATVEELQREVADAQDALRKALKLTEPRLMSFARPGGVPWTVSDEEVKQVLDRHHLVLRPPFWGAVIHVKSIADMEKYVETTIAKGEMGHLDFHGVGGDWLPTPLDYFNATLDTLQAHADQLWITDAISYHKYATQRKSARVEVITSDDRSIRLKLTSDADPAFYDHPLTLRTLVPTAWKTCRISQDGRDTTATVSDGTVLYDALPGTGEITLRPQ